MLIELPNGLVESNGIELFDYVKIDELRGKQQNYLVDKKLVEGNIGHVPKILEDMILSIQTKEGLEWKGSKKDAINRLCIEDLEFILLKIRENTYGPKYYFNSLCIHCGHINKNLKLELDKLDVKKMSLEELTKENKIFLPRCEKELELRQLHLKDIFTSLKFSKDSKDKLITSILSLSVKRIGDKTDITIEDIDNLSAYDIQVLNSYVEENNIRGFIDTSIENTCSKCENEYKEKLNPFSIDFFDPSRGSQT